jgi:ABC-type transport system involved in multi-copper enzyme maturation permease subunit
MQLNPVLRKDLLGLLRLKRVAAVQILFVAVLALLVLASWPQGGVIGGSFSVGAAASNAPSLVRTNDTLLVGLVLGQIAMLILFVPGIAAVALTGEKEANTLEMLYASRLRPGQIISGKIWLAIIYPLILLASGLPFVALLAWRGDLQTADLLWAYAILLVSAIYLSIVSLTISAITKTSATALVIAYGLVLVLCGAVLVPAAIMIQSQSGAPAMLLHYIRALSPVAAALSRFRGQLIETGGASGLIPIWSVFIPAAGLVIVACLAILSLRLQRPPSSSDAFGAVPATEEERTLGRRVMYLIDPKKQPKPFGRTNPVVAKERRTSNLAGWRWMIRIFYAALLLSLGLAVMSLYGGTEHSDLLLYVAQVLVAFQIALIGLVVPSLTSSAISSEIENGTFETLRLTPLRGGQIFWGKFLPAFLPALLPVLALLPAYGTLQFVSEAYRVYFLRLLPVVLLAVVFCCTLGILCSSFVIQTARATVSAYLLTAALFVLPLFGWWAAGEQLSIRVGVHIAFVSPLVMAINLLPAPAGKGAEVSAQIAQLYLPHLYIMGGLCVAMILIARARLSYLLRQG